MLKGTSTTVTSVVFVWGQNQRKLNRSSGFQFFLFRLTFLIRFPQRKLLPPWIKRELRSVQLWLFFFIMTDFSPFHLVSASDPLTFSTKRCRDLSLKREQSRARGGVLSRFLGRQVTLLLSRWLISTPPRAQSGRGTSCLLIRAAGGRDADQSLWSRAEEGWGGLGRTQNAEMTVRGMRTPQGLTLSFVFNLAEFGVWGGEKEGKDVWNTETQKVSHRSADRGWRELNQDPLKH